MEFVTYRKYPNQESAIYVVNLLKKNDIANEFIENKSTLDANFSSSLLDEFEVKIAQEDFVKADEIIVKDSEEYLKTLPQDYYLYSFSNEELKEIIEKRDEWNDLDYTLAINLLKSRGVEITEQEILEVKNKRIEELRKPEKRSTIWINVGYCSAILGGFLGFVIGYLLLTQKKTLPNGERIFAHTLEDRKHGKKILYFGMFFFMFYIFYYFVV
ncbi:hypothetical protein SY27_01470 [Flavobacterium sp. 316]|uniref:Signal transducing protein n=1 Tax=Flavobacterium sediminilitoris TaxID=2024526 RepID=A0ABY4HIZ3_9FLAO|nr:MULTISPECIES: hypothetical protein [Flavobacterium]KIX22536.1 hypothetical protein SY27_01470 [Flavobacterium sp. 316]UOX32802.1 hypothetical protein LXD69_12220 [Flavobacterium sediminilitoris]